jgi:hypothetical protein
MKVFFLLVRLFLQILEVMPLIFAGKYCIIKAGKGLKVIYVQNHVCLPREHLSKPYGGIYYEENAK